MELTDEQYKQVFRYVDGEMDADEQRAFETTLHQNKTLLDEVALYKEVRTLSASVEQKIGNTDSFITSEKKSNDGKVMAMINESRKEWESKYENALKIKNGIPPVEFKSIKREDKKIRRINLFKWLAAAVVAGIVSFGVAFWYAQNKNADSKLAADKKETDSQIINNNNKNINKPENTVQDKPSLQQENASSKNIADKKETVNQNKNGVVKQTRKKYNIAAEKREGLFANNFNPDQAPADADSRLRKAFAYYNTNDFQKALQAFDYSEMLIKRGVDENKKLTSFYTHYYRAQSYLAIDSIARAIPQMKTAIITSPDDFWKSKAQWYLALAHLKTDDVKETERLLEQLVKNKQAGEYKQKAIDLMKELNKER